MMMMTTMMMMMMVRRRVRKRCMRARSEAMPEDAFRSEALTGWLGIRLYIIQRIPPDIDFLDRKQVVANRHLQDASIWNIEVIGSKSKWHLVNQIGILFHVRFKKCLFSKTPNVLGDYKTRCIYLLHVLQYSRHPTGLWVTPITLIL